MDRIQNGGHASCHASRSTPDSPVLPSCVVHDTANRSPATNPTHSRDADKDRLANPLPRLSSIVIAESLPPLFEKQPLALAGTSEMQKLNMHGDA